jgi:GAF domain-containing protein
MIAAVFPANETLRIQALYRTRLLDSIPDEVFQRLARCVAQATGAPIALLTLVDTDRQWFLCRVGLDAEQTPRDVSFCGHAVATAEVLSVNNAFDDKRFFNNPLVVGPPFVRAYLGGPIITSDGLALGTICAIDNEPRNWTEADKTIVRELASVAASLIAARSAKLELQDMIGALSNRDGPRRYNRTDSG